MLPMTDADLKIFDDHLGRYNLRACPCGHEQQQTWVGMEGLMVARVCSVCFHKDFFEWVPLKRSVESYRRTFF